jgi:hypothetical protein
MRIQRFSSLLYNTNKNAEEYVFCLCTLGNPSNIYSAGKHGALHDGTTL